MTGSAREGHRGLPPGPPKGSPSAEDRGWGPTSWAGRRWWQLVEGLVPPRQRRQGLAAAGGVTRLEVRPGCVEARLQVRAATPGHTRLRVPVLTEEQVQRVIQSIAAEAICAARILANQLPEAVDALMTAVGLPLVPSASEVVFECECGAPGPCLHAAAAAYALAHRFDEDPLALFALRGLSDLRQRLSQAPREVAAHADPLLPAAHQAVPPLEHCLEAFWRPGPRLWELATIPAPRHAPAALLRRLGPSPLPGRFPLVGLLASVYDAVAESAVRLRDRAEGL